MLGGIRILAGEFRATGHMLAHALFATPIGGTSSNLTCQHHQITESLATTYRNLMISRLKQLGENVAQRLQ